MTMMAIPTLQSNKSNCWADRLPPPPPLPPSPPPIPPLYPDTTYCYCCSMCRIVIRAYHQPVKLFDAMSYSFHSKAERQSDMIIYILLRTDYYVHRSAATANSSIPGMYYSHSAVPVVVPCEQLQYRVVIVHYSVLLLFTRSCGHAQKANFGFRFWGWGLVSFRGCAEKYTAAAITK